MLGVIFFPDNLDEVGEARIRVVFLAVDERHHPVRFLELVLVDEVHRRLWSEGEGEDQQEADGPLDGEDVAECLLCGVGHEGADDAQGYALHEDCEEDERGLDWGSEFDGRDLLPSVNSFGYEKEGRGACLGSITRPSSHCNADPKSSDHLTSH